MKQSLFLAVALFAPASLLSADSAKDELAAAAKKLAAQPNYSWKATVVVPETARFRPGPTEGKTEKDGFTHVTFSFGDNLTEIVKKGEKAAVTDMNGDWRLASEFENEEGPARFLSTLAKGLKTPAEQVQELLAESKEVKKEGEVYTAVLTEEAVKKQYRFGEPQNPKGSARFWLKDGMLVKMEVKLEAKMEFGGNEFDAARATTTEIKDVGATKLNVPAEAKKKLT